METLKKIFPYAFKEKKDVAALIINILVQIVINIVVGTVLGIISTLLAAIPVVPNIIGLVGALIGLYFFVGVIIAILDYCKVLK